MTTKTYWRDLDIRPAPPGWRVWFRQTADDGLTWSSPLVGWLIQEETPSTEDYADHDTEPGDRRRRIVPTTYVDVPSYLEALGDDGIGRAHWLILGPGEDDPTEAEREKAIADLREHEAWVTARKATAAKDAAPKVLAALQQGPASGDLLASVIGKSETTTWDALRLLESQGLVRRPPEDRPVSGPWSTIPRSVDAPS